MRPLWKSDFKLTHSRTPEAFVRQRILLNGQHSGKGKLVNWFSHGTDGPDLEGLAKFVEMGDRRWTPFFVGREERITVAERFCAETLSLAKRREWVVEGATRVLQGAPGAGKTAILSELKRRWKRKRRTAPVAVGVDAADLAGPARIAINIAEAVRSGNSGEWLITRYGLLAAALGSAGRELTDGSDTPLHQPESICTP